MKGGYFIVWRELFDKQWFHDLGPGQSIVFQLLNRASWRGNRLKDGTELAPGELVIGYREFADACGVSVKKLRGTVETLIRVGFIEKRAQPGAQLGARAGTRITIVNWDIYQNPNNIKGTDEGTGEGTTGAQLGHNKGTNQEGNKERKKEERENARAEDEPAEVECPKCRSVLPDLDGHKCGPNTEPVDPPDYIPTTWLAKLNNRMGRMLYWARNDTRQAECRRAILRQVQASGEDVVLETYAEILTAAGGDYVSDALLKAGDRLASAAPRIKREAEEKAQAEKLSRTAWVWIGRELSKAREAGKRLYFTAPDGKRYSVESVVANAVDLIRLSDGKPKQVTGGAVQASFGDFLTPDHWVAE